MEKHRLSDLNMSKQRQRIEDAGFTDEFFNLTLEEVYDEHLYIDKVKELPSEFNCVEEYFGAYKYPLREETRTELQSSLDVLSSAPYAEVIAFDEAKPRGTFHYDIRVDYWRNRFGHGKELYKILPGDVLILSNKKAETASDLRLLGNSWAYALVVKIEDGENEEEDNISAYFKVKASKDMEADGESWKSMFVVFLINVTTQRRIWNALHLFGNLQVINRVLSSDTLDTMFSNLCSCSNNEELMSGYSRFVSLGLNDSQSGAILACLSKMKCCHQPSVNLIWGPPGTGKTKTVATLLVTLLGMKGRILSCAPTNVAITVLASRTVSIVRDLVDTESGAEVVIYPLGDILLFGNNNRLKVGCEIEEIYLEHRVKELTKCFGPMAGWRYCFTTMIDFLENCSSKYDVYVENIEIKKRELEEENGEEVEECKSFTDFVKDQFKSLSAQLKECLYIICTHVPKSYIGEGNFQKMVSLIGLLNRLDNLLLRNGLTCDKLQDIFSQHQPASSTQSRNQLVLLVAKRFECISALRVLQSSLKELDFPNAISSYAISDFCFQMASLIFCTVACSYKLHSVEMRPLNVLIIDEAAQLKECESTVPLQLPGITHVVLIGDEHQLPATVFSNISSEAGFGKSLFERLSSLGYPKHLLDTQYRMHPNISCFPNSHFYSSSIIDSSVVKSKRYRKQYLPGAMYGSYSFINIFGAKEELDDYGQSRRNLVEVAAVGKILRNLHKAWSSSNVKLSVGIISPYTAQVVAIQERLGRKFENIDGFEIKVKSVDGFQGGEEDIVIISTVRSNWTGDVGFLDSIQRTNVALTRARYCLWILGNEKTLSNSASVWADIVLDAKRRNCFFNADDDEDLAKTILEVKKELNQLNDLLNADSVLFRNARWKVLFSDDFKKSFKSLSSNRIKKSVINLLLRLAGGWRPKKLKINTVCEISSQNLKQFKVENLFVICTVDVIKESQYIQVLKIWNLLPQEEMPKLVKRLDGIFSRYTEDYINHCKEKCIEGDSEVPKSWPTSVDLIQFKTASEIGTELGSVTSEDRDYVENSKVSESLLLMKFYPLSSDVVSVLLSEDSRELDLPFEVTNEEREIILFDRSTFILGRSGTGKTTVLTMKLFQKEHQHYIVTKEAYGLTTQVEAAVSGEDFVEVNQPPVLRQLFVTVSPKLCFAVKQHVTHLKSFVLGGKFLGERQSIDVDYADDTTLFKGIPDDFDHVPSTAYPLVITFFKLLLMLDGSIGNSYFMRFPALRNLSQGATGNLRSNAVQTFIRLNQVTYEVFSAAYWPHFNDQYKKKLDSSRVYTEIMSYIKGGLRTQDGKLSLDEYLQLSDNRASSVGKKKREMIYDIFLQYEKMKVKNGQFDLADFVNDLHRRFMCERYHGEKMDFVYIDEVQDLTMRQISLFKYICQNVEGFVFSGDTAQTIAWGVDFRFQDIRSLFYDEFFQCSLAEGVKNKVQMSKVFQLSQNFRTHAGVLKLAQSVIDLIFRFFPQSIDVLQPETSLIYGEAPILLESGQNENAIITIFGNSRTTASGQMTGFGAEQVILVRDDNVRKEIAEFVGKQALVLTIVECKGLEFQDVLLYNFFASSPLKNQWRVIYEYMKEQNLLDANAQVAFPNFNEAKHSLMGSELKQLYVAITRTRQRLWICDSIEEFSKPMFDYWKKQCFAQVRVLDESLAQAMQVASSTEEWKSRGFKLLTENNYEMATMCFERAGDEYWGKFSKAAGLRADADLRRISYPEMARSILKEAAEMFHAIGKADRAAECYFDLEEFEKAGKLYLESCGESKLDLAGDCFYRAGCFDHAAEVYAKGKFFSQCLKVCTQAKLFDKGLQYIQYWKQLADTENIGKGIDIDKMEQKFIEDCANHYHSLKDSRSMMKCVKSFQSTDLMRAFLKSRSCIDELVLLEVELGNFKEAAECYFDLGEFEKAGKLYLECCGESKLDLAGDCFYRAGCFDHAAEVYAKGKFFSQCLKVCTQAKLFDKGLQYIQYWKQLADTESIGKGIDIDKMEQKFIEDRANHYHSLKDSRSMMKCVKSFQSTDLMRAFLKSRSCIDELVLLEVELGNFKDAAKIVKQRGDLLFEADLLAKAGQYKEASLQIVWCVLARSFSASESTGWPLMGFSEKEQLLTKAADYAKLDSPSFYEVLASNIGVLSDKKCTLLEMHEFLRSSLRLGSLKGEFFSVRKILDSLLHLDISKYLWEDELIADLRKHMDDKISKNQASQETLVYFWKLWNSKVVEVLHCLTNLESEKENEDYEEHEELCLNVMGVWPHVTDKNTDYIIISPGMHWLKEVGKGRLKKIGELVSIDFQSVISASKSFWSLELLTVGMKMLEVLESLYKHSIKNSKSIFRSSVSIICIFEAAQFLYDCPFLQHILRNRYCDASKLQKLFQLVEDELTQYIYPLDWKKSLVENMVSLRGTECCQKVLEEVIVLMLSGSGDLTHGLIGRIVMILLGSAGFTDNLYGKVMMKFADNPAWQIFVNILGSVPRLGVTRPLHPSRLVVIGNFQAALADTYNVNWSMVHDYMSPVCFLYCMERLFLLASCSPGVCFTTKSSFVEWFVSKEKLHADVSTELCRGTLDYVKFLVEQILADKATTTRWITRSKLDQQHYQLLVLRLMILLCLICLKTGNHFDTLFHWLSRHHIASVLPSSFTGLLWKCQKTYYLGKVHLIAEALGTIENPLVIISTGGDCSKFSGTRSILINVDDSREIIFRKLFPERVAQTTVAKDSPAERDAPPSQIRKADSPGMAKPVEVITSSIGLQTSTVNHFLGTLWAKLSHHTT